MENKNNPTVMEVSPEELKKIIAMISGEEAPPKEIINKFEYQEEVSVVDSIKLLKPNEIKEYLDQYVIGQEEAKKTLSVAVYNHYKMIKNNARAHDIEIGKSNILMLGETGCGKTLLMKTIAKLLNVPFYIANATSLTESGYVGDDVESVIVGLLRDANYDIERTQYGICVIDEIDKIAKKGAGPSLGSGRDVSGEGVQQGLLKMVEGNVVGVPPFGGRKHPEQQLLYVDTTNILFVVTGAFVGIEDIVKRRLGGAKIGFNTSTNKSGLSDEDYINYVTPQDLKAYGMIPEFVGRFPVITNVNKLTAEDLVRILKEPNDALIKQYQELFKADDCVLTFDNDALKLIADATLQLETGARGLRNIVESIMIDYMYDVPSSGVKKLKITKAKVIEKLDKRCKYKLTA